MSASLGAPAAADDVVPVVPELTLVPGGNTGLGAVLGEVDWFCANAAEIEMIQTIPKKTLTNSVGRSFIARESVWKR